MKNKNRTTVAAHLVLKFVHLIKKLFFLCSQIEQKKEAKMQNKFQFLSFNLSKIFSFFRVGQTLLFYGASIFFWQKKVVPETGFLAKKHFFSEVSVIRLTWLWLKKLLLLMKHFTTHFDENFCVCKLATELSDQNLEQEESSFGFFQISFFQTSLSIQY